jgi:hypothetical protein
MLDVYQGIASELAFLFRSIPANERQLRGGGSPPASGVRFPSYSR